VAEYRHAIIGAGPVGTMLAWALTQNGVPFAWVVRNPLRRDTLDPLHVFTDHPRYPQSKAITTVLSSAAELQYDNLDWLVLAVKAQHVEPLLASLPPFAHEQLLVVANGLQTGPFVLGVLYGGARLDEHGFLHCCEENKLHLGALGLMHPAPAALLRLAAELAVPQLQPCIADDIHTTMWCKAALNCVVNPLTALLDCENGGLLWMLDSPLIAGLLAETAQVMLADGVQLPGDATAYLQDELQRLVQATAANSSSMREDFRNRRETEIGRLNLAVAEMGRLHGLECPLNAALGHMVSCLANRGAL
jgi:2-dehydropantoate 2-reductase